MRAVTVGEYGGAPALTDMSNPHPGPGEVLIKIQAAGMNPMDRNLANGVMKATMPASFPFILGSDLAGTVEAVGEGAAKFKSGDEVFGHLLIAPLGSAGTYAEYVAITEDAPLTRIPEGLDPTIAAALPTAGAAALEIVESLGRLTGKTVLVVGAAGGVGSFATQIAANAGAHVIAVDAGAEDRLRAYGAAETVDYTADSVPDAVARTHPDGIDVLVDMASDADGFAALASVVHTGGVALTTRFVADTEALASRGVAGVNYWLEMSTRLLERLANAVVDGSIVGPPVTVIELDHVSALSGNAPASGKRSSPPEPRLTVGLSDTTEVD